MKCSCTHVCVYPLLEGTLNVCCEGFGWGNLQVPPKENPDVGGAKDDPLPTLSFWGAKRRVPAPLIGNQNTISPRKETGVLCGCPLVGS